MAKRTKNPLETAVEKKDWDGVESLIKAGAEFTKTTAPQEIVSAGRADLLKLLLDRGLDPNHRIKSYGALLTYALHHCKGEEGSCADVLIDAGADPRKADDYASTDQGSMLMFPIQRSQPRLIRRLVEAGADVDRPINEDGETPLMRACSPFFGGDESLRCLISLGADLERTDARGRTALNIATDPDRPNESAAAILRAAGAREHDIVEPEPEPEPDHSDPIERVPFAERRGTIKVFGYNSWYTTAVFAGDAGALDAIADALSRVEKVGAVERDVTAAALAGDLDQPDAPHVLLLKLEGHDWLLAAESWAHDWSDNNLAKQLSTGTGRPALQCVHQDTAGASGFTLYESGTKRVSFESCGEEYHADEDDEVEMPTHFASDRHAADWWRQHSDENETIQQLFKDLNAYAPAFGFTAEEGKIRLDAFPQDTLSPDHVERVMLAVYGPASAARPNPAARQLVEAIGSHDVNGVKAALAAGANQQFLPGVTGTALSLAVRCANNDDEQPASLDVIRALLDAGANPNDGGPAGPPALIPFDLVGWSSHRAIPVLELLIAAGADVHAKTVGSFGGGQTALHRAAKDAKLPLVRFLLAHGADVHARDAQGLTPAGAVHESIKAVEEYAGASTAPEPLARYKGILAELQNVEAGNPPGEWQSAAAEEAARERARRDELQAAFGQLKDAFKVLAGDKAATEAAVARLATESMPQTITVKRDDAAEWGGGGGHPKTGSAAAIIRRGFIPIGTFTVPEIPAFRMWALWHGPSGTFAVACEQGAIRWVDLVRYHADGSSVTFTNADVLPAARAEPPGHRKVRMPGAAPIDLLDALTKEPMPSGGPARITAGDFPARFREAYQREMAYRRGGSA